MVANFHRVTAWRKASYVVTCVAILVVYFLIRGHSWHASLQSLISMELVAMVLSLCVGSLSLVRYYSQRDITFLFIGAGFIVNGLLTGGHTAITLTYVNDTFQDSFLRHSAWSWYGSRLFFPVLLWLSWFFGMRQKKHGADSIITNRVIYHIVAVSPLALLFILDIAPSQGGSMHALLFNPVMESIPAIFFTLSLIGYYRKGKWQTDPFEYWLILGLIMGLMSEVLFIPNSQADHLTAFGMAYMLKIAAYLCAFIGLLFNLWRLFSDSLMQQELVRKNLILKTQQETSQDAILVVNEQDRIASYNRRFVELWGLPPKLVEQGDDRPVLAFTTAQTANPDEFRSRIEYLYQHRDKTSIDEIHLKDGTILDRYSAPLVGEDGKYYGRVWYFRDVTGKKYNEQLMRESEEKFRSLIEQSLVGIAMIEDGHYSYINSKFAEIFGYDVYDIMHLAPVEMAVREDMGLLEEVMHSRLANDGENGTFTFRGRHKDGYIVNIEGRCARMNFGGKNGLMMIIMDVTERVRAEHEVQALQIKLREQAIRDPLTGLFNRRYLDEVIASEMARAERGAYPMSLIMCDIDRFKWVNDEYGHLAGDEVLRAFSRLLKQYARGGDVICRYGGEEFLLVLPGMTREGAVARAEQLRLAFSAALMSHDSIILRGTASFGVATFPEDGHDIDTLIGAADKALYQAKESGRNQVKEYAA